MPKTLYLINPRPAISTYFGAEVLEEQGFSPTQAIADLATATVAALVPETWDVSLCDEHVEPIDFDTTADFVGITGKVTQERRMLEVAEEFRRRGKTVVIGGPHASLVPQIFRGRCDVLVIGELENIAGKLFADLERGSWQEEYVGDKPDLSLSPLPRWDLYSNEKALVGCVQTSRGCPFECEFCDVIQYLGRNQRHKSTEQVIAECDVMYDLGYRSVFLADDNLTVHRKRTKELLARLAEWNEARRNDPMSFGTQLSIDAGRDAAVMDLLGRCGMSWVFIGIETPNVESLKETGKRQNIGVDLQQLIGVFLEHGIAVIGGMIVGFDHDGPDIFEIQYEFAEASPIPIFTMSALVAPHSTPLYDRMERDGRLVGGYEDFTGAPWQTNIVPSRLTREQLMEGMRWLGNRLYQPEAFGQRMLQMIEAMGPQRGPFRPNPDAVPGKLVRPVVQEAVGMLRKFVRQGKRERKLWIQVAEAMAEKPGSETAVMVMLFRYAQVRCLYEGGQFWEPRVAEASPFAGVTGAATPTPADPEKLVSIGG